MKSSLPFLACFVAFFFSTHPLTAASPWRKITLYTTTGDSITGEISIKTTFKSFYAISVRDKVTHVTKEYLPKDVKSFVIHTPEQMLYFKTFQVEADFSQTDLSQLGISPLITLEKDMVFAQLLVNGDKELYCYKDNRVYKEHYLLRTSDIEAIDLINKRYYINSTKTSIAYNEEYKKQLNKLLTNSPSVKTERINQTPFRQSELISLIKEYNTSLNTPNSYELKEERLEVNFGIVGGFNRTSLKFSGANFGLNNATFNKSFGANAGIKLEIIIPKTQKKWSIYNEALLSNYSFSSNEVYSYYKDEKDYEKVQYQFKATYLKIVNAARFKFPHEFSPFIQAGIVNGFALNYTSSRVKQHVFYSASDLSKERYMFRSYEQSAFAGVGCIYKQVGLEVRYEIGNGMSVETEVGSAMRYTYVLLSYTF